MIPTVSIEFCDEGAIDIDLVRKRKTTRINTDNQKPNLSNQNNTTNSNTSKK